MLFDALEAELEGTNQEGALQRIYRGRWADYVQCKACLHQSTNPSDSGPHMVHCHTVHLPRGGLLTPCTMCGTGAHPRPPLPVVAAHLAARGAHPRLRRLSARAVPFLPLDLAVSSHAQVLQLFGDQGD